MQAKSLYAFLIRLINIGMGNDIHIAIFSKNSVGIGTGDRENRQIAVSVSRYSYKVSLTTLYRSHSIGSNIFVTITIYWVSMYRDCRNLDNFFSDNFFYFIRKEPASSRSIMQQKRREWLLKLIFGMIHGTAAGRGTGKPVNQWKVHCNIIFSCFQEYHSVCFPEPSTLTPTNLWNKFVLEGLTYWPLNETQFLEKLVSRHYVLAQSIGSKIRIFFVYDNSSN